MEWTVVTALIALCGLMGYVLKAAIPLVRSITKVTGELESLVKDMVDFSNRNKEAHTRLWEKNKEQDERLHDHDKRITVMESEKNKQ